jgi:MinD-like ATPase involved in chromosome partitioning or flagellar assembly
VLTAITSGKAAPGVTTAAWALALAWPRTVLVADCDPAGGDMAAGLLVGRVSLDRGLLSWSTSARRGTPALAAASMLAAHVVEVPEQSNVWLLPGFANATQAHSFTEEVWERLALALERSAAAIHRDALVDTGRLAGERGNWPVLRAAERVLVAVRPSVRSVHAAQDLTQRLRYELGDLAKVAALVVGDGPYTAKEVAAALELPVAGELPTDRHAAATLSDGGGGTMRTLQRSALLKAAAGIAQRLTAGQPSLVGCASAEATR